MMDDHSMDATFAALADPTRRQMVERLLQGEATVTELAEPHDMSMPAVLKHVTKLVDAGLVTRRKEGRVVTCTLNPSPMDEAQAWLQRHLDFWNNRLDALDAYLRQNKDDGA